MIYKGGPPAQQPQMSQSARGPLPQPTEDDYMPPPPPNRGQQQQQMGHNVSGSSADNSLNDSNSTTQSNLASECSEAECDREPLVKNQAGNRGM